MLHTAQAAGSSLLAKVCNFLVLDALRVVRARSCTTRRCRRRPNLSLTGLPTIGLRARRICQMRLRGNSPGLGVAQQSRAGGLLTPCGQRALVCKAAASEVARRANFTNRRVRSQ